jgi:ribosomal protein L37AE/L43A
MGSYSKESERENKALGDLLAGRDPEKRIMVGYNSGKEPEKHGDKIHRLSDIMKEARMPWFCPECDKTMKKKLDNKFWRLMGHCFDCQIRIENKLRVEGKWEEYEKKKIFENKKAYLKDLKQSIDEFEASGGKTTFFNEVGVTEKGVEKEEWSMGQENFDKLVDEAREYIERLEMELEDEIV